jgi:hypothetical protein
MFALIVSDLEPAGERRSCSPAPLRVPTAITASFGGLSQDDGDHGNEAVIAVGALRSMAMSEPLQQRDAE